MSNQTIPDPGRFSQRDEPEQQASAGSRALSGLALLALVIGVPVVLWLLAGTDPFPTSLPTKETLTGQLTFTTLLDVLLFVVWLAWLFFLVCVLVEVAAARRGGLAQPVPLGGPVQKVARALVGALLLAEVISGPAASAMAPVEHSGAEVAASASVVQAVRAGHPRHPPDRRRAPGRARDHRAGAPGRSQGLHGGRAAATATTTTSGTSRSGTSATAAATARSTS